MSKKKTKLDVLWEIFVLALLMVGVACAVYKGMHGDLS